MESRTPRGLFDGIFEGECDLSRSCPALQARSVVLGHEPHEAQNGEYDQGEERPALGRCHGEHGKVPS